LNPSRIGDQLESAVASVIESNKITRCSGPTLVHVRLTNGFSNKIENHGYSLALHYMHYNFCRIHKSLRVTPAMEAGVSNHVWSVEEIADLLN
jgi:hypothetical protein